MSYSRAAELARCRAARGLTDEDCQVWFGVGLATLERVEAGEVLPSGELEQRIGRFLQVCGGGFAPLNSAALPGHASATSHGPTGGGGGETVPSARAPAVFSPERHEQAGYTW